MSSAKSFMTDMDQVGVPVGLTYKSEDTHKTFVGGCMSILCGTLVLFYGGVQLVGLFTAPQYNNYQFTTYRDGIGKNFPVIDNIDHNSFPMIGVRSALPDAANGVAYDQTDAYDISVVSYGIS